MMMAGDRPRIEKFWGRLEKKDFEVIVVSPLHTEKFGNEVGFALENNLWVQGISSFILNNYQPILTLPNYELELLVPKPDTETVG
jgi:hypothetical protein